MASLLFEIKRMYSRKMAKAALALFVMVWVLPIPFNIVGMTLVPFSFAWFFTLFAGLAAYYYYKFHNYSNLIDKVRSENTILTTMKQRLQAARSQTFTAKQTLPVDAPTPKFVAPPIDMEPILSDQNMVNASLYRLAELVLRDFVYEWYRGLSPSDDTFPQAVREFMLRGLKVISDRGAKLDPVFFVVPTIVEACRCSVIMYREAKLALKRNATKSFTMNDPVQRERMLLRRMVESKTLHGAAVNPAYEQEYLRRMAAGLCKVLLRPEERACGIMRHFGRELFANSLLKPIFGFATPETINRGLAGLGKKPKSKKGKKKVGDTYFDDSCSEEGEDGTVHFGTTVIVGEDGEEEEINSETFAALRSQDIDGDVDGYRSHRLSVISKNMVRHVESTEKARAKDMLSKHIQKHNDDGDIINSNILGMVQGKAEFGSPGVAGSPLSVGILEEDEMETQEATSLRKASCAGTDITSVTHLRERLQDGDERLGAWRANIQGAKVVHNKLKSYVIYVIHVEGDPMGEEVEEGPMDNRLAWTIFRRYSDFTALHKIMKTSFPFTYKLHLPPKRPFGNFDSAFVEDRRLKLEAWLQKVLAHPQLALCKDVHRFLSPSTKVSRKERRKEEKEKVKAGPVDVDNPYSSARRASTPHEGSDGEEEGDVMEAVHYPTDNKDAKHESGIDENSGIYYVSHEDAERLNQPLYAFVDEVFELRAHKYGRRLVTKTANFMFKQVLGESVTVYLIKKVREVSNETALNGLVDSLIESLWPNGQFFLRNPDKPGPATPAQISREKEQAKKVMCNLPSSITTLIGKEHCQHTMLGLFEMLQYPQLVKNVAFLALDSLLMEMFPEMAKDIEKANLDLLDEALGQMLGKSDMKPSVSRDSLNDWKEQYDSHTMPTDPTEVPTLLRHNNTVNAASMIAEATDQQPNLPPAMARLRKNTRFPLSNEVPECDARSSLSSEGGSWSDEEAEVLRSAKNFSRAVQRSGSTVKLEIKCAICSKMIDISNVESHSQVCSASQ